MNQIIFNVIIVMAFIVLVAVFLLLPSPASSKVYLDILLGNIDAVKDYAYFLSGVTRDDIPVYTYFDPTSAPNDVEPRYLDDAADHCDGIYTSLIDTAVIAIGEERYVMFDVDQYEVSEVTSRMSPEYPIIYVSDNTKYNSYAELGYNVFYIAKIWRNNGASKDVIGDNPCAIFVQDAYDIEDLVTSDYSNLNLILGGSSFRSIRNYGGLKFTSIYVIIGNSIWYGNTTVPGIKRAYVPYK